MTDTAVAADIHQSLDVELNERTAFALDLDTHLGDRCTNRADLVVRPVLNFEIVADACRIKDLAGRRATDTVDIGQTDLASLVFR